MLKILILCCIVLMNIGDNTMEQSSKKRSGTVAGMKDGLKKATTDMLVLFLLRQKPMYAYEMLQEMARLSDGVLQFNTLYIAIYRLQEHGYISPSETVVTESNRTRVYFSITEQGSGYLDDIIAEYFYQLAQSGDALIQFRRLRSRHAVGIISHRHLKQLGKTPLPHFLFVAGHDPVHRYTPKNSDTFRRRIRSAEDGDRQKTLPQRTDISAGDICINLTELYRPQRRQYCGYHRQGDDSEAFVFCFKTDDIQYFFIHGFRSFHRAHLYPLNIFFLHLSFRFAILDVGVILSRSFSSVILFQFTFSGTEFLFSGFHRERTKIVKRDAEGRQKRNYNTSRSSSHL